MADDHSAKPPDDASTETDNRSTAVGEETDGAGPQSVHFTVSESTSGGPDEDVEEGRLNLDLPTSGYSQQVVGKDRPSLAVESYQLQLAMKQAEEATSEEEEVRTQRERMAAKARLQFLENEILDYKRKVANLQDGQQRQLTLIQSLQGQVNEYKRKNTDLEIEIEELKLDNQTKTKKLQSKTMENDSRLEARENMAKMREDNLIAEMENIAANLEQERAKSSELARINEALQDQLEEAALANQGLSRDVAQLTQAWRQATQQLERREVEWHTEEVAFNDYFASEHNRLLALWREVVALRRQFTELRHQTSRDFAQINSEIMRFSHGMHAACTTLATNLKASQLESADALAKSRRQLMKEEEDAKLRTQSLNESLARSQSKLAEAESKLIELAQKNQELADELTERDRVLNTLQRLRSSFPRIAVETLEEQAAPTQPSSAVTGADDPISATRRLIEQTYTMHQALSQIAQMVIADSAGADADEAQEPLITSFQVRYKSPDEHLADLTAMARSEHASPSPPPSSRRPRPRSTSPPSNGSGETIAPRITRSRSPARQQPEFDCLRASRSVPKLAETTVAGVQTALNRRSMQVQALRLKLTHLRGRITALNKRLEDGDAERRRLGEQVASLRNDCDLTRKEAEVARLERDKSKNALSLSLEEKNILERSRVTTMEQLASMQNEMEQLRQLLQTTSRERDEVAEQRDEKRLAYESETRETARLQRLLEQAETRSSQLREKITELQDLQRRTQMEKDVLGHEKSEVLDRAEKAEQKLIDLDKKMANMRKDEDHLHDTLVRLENIAEARECERAEMAHQLHLVQANESRLAEDRNSLRTECQRLRNQLTRAEMEHSAASAETERLRDALTQAERLHKQVEAEVAVVSKERFELTEALAASSRQNSSLTEELDNLRRETGLQANTINRLTSEKEELLQEKTDLTSRISVADRERRQLNDLVAKLRTDKEVLENEAFIAQRVITDLKNKEEKLETDVANLTLRRKNLQAEVHRIRTDFEVELAKIQRQRDRLDNKYTSEVDELRMALANADRRLAEAEEAAVQAVLRADRAAAEAAKATLREADRHGLTELECQRWVEEQGQLNVEILVAQRERDEALRKAEQEHQRVLAIAAEDQAAVRERAMLLQETIVDLEKTLERTKREAASRAEKDEIALKTTTEDLHKCREQLEETCASHEREVLGFRTQIKTLQENYEMTSKELSNAQLQLRLHAESRLSNRSEVSETAKLLRESEESCQLLRRECLEFRKRQSELEAEKCSVEAANSDLRRQLRTLELERVEQGCSLTELQNRLEACDKERRTNERLLLDLRQNIEDAGKSDATARREVSELRLQLKETDTLNEQLKQTVSDLRASLVEELANVEEMKRESVNLRQRLSEAESVRHALQTEVSLAQRRLTELEEKLRSRERTMNQALEDCKRDTKRMEESKQLLQSRLDTAEQQATTVRANLATQEGRIRSLQNDLNWTAALRKDAEARLAAIHGLLRRLLGFRQSLRSTGWVTTTTPELAITPTLRSKVRTMAPAATPAAPGSDQQQQQETAAAAAAAGPGGSGNPAADKEAPANGGGAGSPREAGNKTLISERRAGDEDPVGGSPSSSRRARSISPDKRYIDFESRSLSGERHFSRLQTSAWSDIFCEAKEAGCGLDFGKSPAGDSESSPPTGHAVSVPDCTTSAFSGISAMPYGLRKRLARLAASSSYLQSVPGSDLDPDAVCSALRELLRHLLRLERDRDDALLAVRVREEKAQDQKAQLAERDDLIGQLRANQRKLEEDNKVLMERIMDIQNNLSHQESATSRAVKERDALQSNLNDLQKRLAHLEAESKKLQERLSISRLHTVKSNDECRLIRRALEDSESRVNAAEVARRNLETEFQRQRNTLTDRSAELQASNARLDTTLKDLSAAENRISELNCSVERLTQLCSRNAMTESEAKDQAERLTARVNELQHENSEMHERITLLQRQLTASDHETRILQERNENIQNSLFECKNQLQQMHDRIQKLQAELSAGDLQRSELETQNRQLHNQISEQDNVQKDLLQQLLTLQCNKENAMEKVSTLTKSNTECEKEKADLEVELKQQKSEMQQLKKTLERMTKERLREKEASSRLLSSQDDVKKNVRQLEEENLELRRHLQRLQAQIILQDEAHMNQLEEVSKRKNAKIEAELEKKCSALMHSEKVLQAKERSHRQRIKGLEEQIRTLSDQLTQEISRRHLYMSTGKLPTSPAAAVPLTYSASASLRGRYPSGPGSSHASFLLSHASRETLVHQSNIDTEPVKEDDAGRATKSKPPSGMQSTPVCESQPSIAESQVTKSGRAQPLPLESSERTTLGLLRVASSNSSQLMESPKKYGHVARSASLDMDY